VNFLRRLQDLLNPPARTPAAGINPTPSTAIAEHDAIAATDEQRVFAAMAFFARHPGVPDHTDPDFPEGITQ
jgi:hypothetical protein